MFSHSFYQIKHVIKHSAEDDLIRNDSQTNAEQQKRDRYAKLVKENDELTEQITRVSLFEELMCSLIGLKPHHLLLFQEGRAVRQA